MSNNNNLLNELLDKKNLLFNDDDSFNISKLYTNYIFFLICFAIILSGALLVLDNLTLIHQEFSFNAFISLLLGYTSLIYSVRLIKEKTIPYYSANPIMLIALFYPGFFNSELFNFINNHFLHINININVVLILLSVIINYIILNYFYMKYYKQGR